MFFTKFQTLLVICLVLVASKIILLIHFGNGTPLYFQILGGKLDWSDPFLFVLLFQGFIILLISTFIYRHFVNHKRSLFAFDAIVYTSISALVIVVFCSRTLSLVSPMIFGLAVGEVGNWVILLFSLSEGMLLSIVIGVSGYLLSRKNLRSR